MSGIHFGHSHFAPLAPRRTADRPATPFSSIPPGAKAALLVVTIVTTVSMPLRFWFWHVGLAAALIALALAARLPWRGLLLRLLLLAPFIAGVAAAAALRPQADRLWLVVAVRGVLCVAAVSVFSAVTPLGSLPGLLRRLGVPALLVTTLALMHRYLHVLNAEAERMHRARACRSFGRTRRGAWLLSADLVGRLFIRASERAERIYLAMCARGWK